MAQAHGLQVVLMLTVVWLAPELRQPTPAPPPVAAVRTTPVVAEPQAVPSVAHEPIPANLGTITPIPVRVIPIVRDVSPELSEPTSIKTPQHVPLPSEPPPVVMPADEGEAIPPRPRQQLASARGPDLCARHNLRKQYTRGGKS
jgi:hypothetical protein